jgi:hypothetical protein
VVGVLGELFELVDDLGSAVEDLVLGDEGFEVDAHALGGEVADVAHGGFDDVTVAEVLVDGLGLGGGLDDDEVLGLAGLFGRPGLLWGRRDGRGGGRGVFIFVGFLCHYGLLRFLRFATDGNPRHHPCWPYRPPPRRP